MTASPSRDDSSAAQETDPLLTRPSSEEAILRAFLTLVEGGATKRPTFAEIADEAGVGVRTVHRYFPTRSALDEAAGEWVYDNVYNRAPWDDPTTVGRWIESFPETPAMLAKNIHLIRTMGRSDTATGILSPLRRRRRQGVEAAVKGVAAVPEDTAKRASALVMAIDAVRNWVALHDALRFTSYDVVATIDWAVTAVLDDLGRPGGRVRSFLALDAPADGGGSPERTREPSGGAPLPQISAQGSLRRRQSLLAQQTILEAYSELLATGSDEPSYSDVAKLAGVATRTVYRYFPSRQDINGAMARRLVEPCPPALAEPSTVGDRSLVRAELTSQIEAQLPTVRGIIHAGGGSATAAAIAAHRLRAVRAATAQAAGNLPRAQTRRAIAMIRLIEAPGTWVELSDEGLDIRDVVSGADTIVSVLLDDLRRRSTGRQEPE